MLPPRRLFRSRWIALLWAAGVLWSAAEIAGSAPPPHVRKADAAMVDALGDPVDAADLAAIANAAGG